MSCARWLVLPCFALVFACGGDDADDGGESSETASSSSTESSENTVGTQTDSGSEADSTGDGSSTSESAGDGDGDTGGDGDGDGDGDGEFDCDYIVGDNGVLMFEAESLPLVDDWTEASSEPGAYGTGYIYWAGQSFNGQPGNGLIERHLGIPEAGRYRLMWRTRIGMGADATEHNDVWLRFPDAAGFYGKRDNSPETRRYPKPLCEDAGAMAAVEATPEVSEAICSVGSTSDGWLKVYSSGATDWSWSARTSDSDAHDIHVEFDAPGVYKIQLSARADWSLLDRVVLFREAVDTDTAYDEAQAETPCP